MCQPSLTFLLSTVHHYPKVRKMTIVWTLAAQGDSTLRPRGKQALADASAQHSKRICVSSASTAINYVEVISSGWNSDSDGHGRGHGRGFCGHNRILVLGSKEKCQVEVIREGSQGVHGRRHDKASSDELIPPSTIPITSSTFTIYGTWWVGPNAVPGTTFTSPLYSRFNYFWWRGYDPNLGVHFGICRTSTNRKAQKLWSFHAEMPCYCWTIIGALILLGVHGVGNHRKAWSKAKAKVFGALSRSRYLTEILSQQLTPFIGLKKKRCPVYPSLWLEKEIRQPPPRPWTCL